MTKSAREFYNFLENKITDLSFKKELKILFSDFTKKVNTLTKHEFEELINTFTTKQIAEKLNITQSYVYILAKNADIEIPKRKATITKSKILII